MLWFPPFKNSCFYICIGHYSSSFLVLSSMQSEEQVSQVVVKQQMQLQSDKKTLEENDVLKRELNEEKERRVHAENNLETYRQRFVSLKSRRGVERLEEKEVVQYYRDPKVEAELQSLKNKIQEETSKRSGTRTKIEITTEMVLKMERELSTIEPKLVTKVLTEYERDPQLDKEMTRIREEMRRMRMDLQARDTETVQKGRRSRCYRNKPQRLSRGW